VSTSRRTFLEWTLGAAGSAWALGLAASCGGGQTRSDELASQHGGQAIAEKKEAEARKARILILGGTGFLGPQLVEIARARGHRITLFNRGKSNPHLFPEIEKLRGDRDGDLEALRGREWDAVIDTSGYVPRIVRASAELLAPAVEHYVFISSISVYANFARKDIDEQHPVGTLDDKDRDSEDVRAHYGQLKALCEQAAEASMPGRVANIRPGLIVGPGDGTDRFTYWPVRVARGGEVLAPGSGDDGTQFIDVRDLAAWTIEVVEMRHRGVYNAVGPDLPISMKAFLSECKRVTGSDATFTWVPADFLEAQKVAPWMQMPMWIPAKGEDIGFASVSNRKAVERGLKFRPVEDTVRATLEWFRSLPEERQTRMRAGLPAEREAEVLSAWRDRT
jgi:2'-hydroxyisoflavone reductase